MTAMSDPTVTWMVLHRDVSEAIRVRGERRLCAALVLDVGTGLVRGMAVARTRVEALAEAFDKALTKPAGPLSPAPPAAVVCGPGLAAPVAHAFRSLTELVPAVPITEVVPGLEAEDIFDSFIGHMSGRNQPEALPAEEDWRMLFEKTSRFYEAEPWARWSDDVDLALEMEIGGERLFYSAVVMGNAGLQHGLVLHPGEAAPAGLRGWAPGEALPMPPGTLVCILDPPGEPPAELGSKALRYGWPPEAKLVPAFASFETQETGRDLAAAETRRMAVAMEAVLALDARGPVLVQRAAKATTGEVHLPHGPPAKFTISPRHRDEEKSGPRLRMREVGSDLVRGATGIVLGHLAWSVLSDFRRTARLHRPAPADFPHPSGKEIPLVVILPKARHGDRIAAKLAELDPFGIGIVETGDRQAILTLVGTNGAEMLMDLPADSSELKALHRRLRQTKGRHLVMVADESASTANGKVYGLFECHQPPPDRPRSGRPARSSEGRPKRRR